MTKEELKKEVKKWLWSYGLSVKDVEEIPGVEYDLLVDGKVRVKVVASTIAQRDQDRVFKDCDVLAVIVGLKNDMIKLLSSGQQGKNGLVTFSKYTPLPLEVFPRTVRKSP